jgi:hypothetical protein
MLAAVWDQLPALLAFGLLVFVVRFRPWRWLSPWVRRG